MAAKREDVVLPLVSALLQTEWSPAVEVRKLEYKKDVEVGTGGKPGTS